MASDVSGCLSSLFADVNCLGFAIIIKSSLLDGEIQLAEKMAVDG